MMLFKRKKQKQNESDGIHNLRTANVLVDTFDFIKKIAYLFEFGIQLVYIAYLIFKTAMRSGWMVGNIILLVLAVTYLIYHIIATNRTFNTREEKVAAKRQIKITKRVFRILKRLTNLAIIIYATYQLNNAKSPSNVDLLFLVFMIIGFVSSIVCDIIIYVVDARIQLIKDAIAVDVVDFKENHRHMGKVFDFWTVTKDLEVDEKQRERVDRMRDRVKDKHPHFFHRKKKAKDSETNNTIDVI